MPSIKSSSLGLFGLARNSSSRPKVRRILTEDSNWVASEIDSDINKTTTIYRRFDELSARNSLFYQAELVGLEDAQREYDEVDRNAKDLASIECQRDWSEFEKHAGEEYGVVQKREKEKMEVAMKIREKLEKYHRWTTACEICVTNRMDRCGASSPPTPPKQSNALK
jgi:hypothetical protein